MGEWKKVKLKNILSESKLLSQQPDPDRRLTVRLNTKGIEKRPFAEDKTGATKYYIRKSGQFIYGKQNFHKGAFGVIPENLDGFESSSDLPAFDVGDDCIPDWLVYWFKVDNRYETLSQYARGIGSQRISPEEFLNLDILMPDKIIQKKVLNGIYAAENIIQKQNNEYEKQIYLLSKLRQSILQEAIEGKLTTEWRKTHPVIKGNPDYDAAALLEVIKKEKAKLIADGKLKKEKFLPEIANSEKPFELPEGWVWCRLGEVCDFITKGTTPAVHELKNEGDIPYLKVYNIVNQQIDFFYKPQFISYKIHDQLNRSKVYPGDVLMNIVGPPLGKVAMIPDAFPEWNINQALAIFRPVVTGINHYLYKYLLSGFEINKIQTLGVVGQDNISLEQCRNIVFAMPPLSEQQAIVERVDSLLAMDDVLEKQVNERKVLAEELMQSVLREAFER